MNVWNKAALNGKGTVAGILKGELNIPHISTGEIFRKNIKEGTELGKIATKYADEGKLVPDEVTNEMVKSVIFCDIPSADYCDRKIIAL